MARTNAMLQDSIRRKKLKQSKEKFLMKCNLQKYSLQDIRYAAYSITDEAHVALKKLNLKTIEISFKRKGKGSLKNVVKRFTKELKDEKMRAEIFENNSELREHLILQALNYEEKPKPQADDAGLTPEQEKELDDLISQVEKELEEETSGCKKSDPLEINKTWEEKNAGKSKKNKK
jgi:His-Xaa-Ser system protein HxsD